MSPEMEFRHKLAALARRLRLLAIERRVSWCLLPGLVLALLLLAAHKLDRLDEPQVFKSHSVTLSETPDQDVSVAHCACQSHRCLAVLQWLSVHGKQSQCRC